MEITDNAEVLRTIKAISGASALTRVEARAGQELSLQLAPGQEIRAEVLASLSNGRFVVKIAGELLDMNLPSTVRTGETVQLTFVTEKPRLTFTLSKQGGSASPATVSDAGRWLTLLAHTPAGSSLPLEDITRIIQHSAKGTLLVRGEGGSPGEKPSLNLMPGQQARAEIVAELPTGRVQVKLADQLLEMNLPKSARGGSELSLMFISDKPQLLFALPQPSNGAAANALNQVGRWLSFVTRVNAAETPAPAPSPLLPAPVGNAAEPEIQGLAGRLREALSRSGVFYESHVADWVAGKSTIHELLLEPQGKLSQPAKADDVRKSNPETAVREATPGNIREAVTGMTGREAKVAEIADQQTLHLIRQQLSVLQNAHFVWQGEAWPGQRMDWTVEEREAEQGSSPDRHWSTTLSLELPHLGKVSADVTLQGKQLQVNIQAESPASATAMREQTQKLQDGMSAAGLALADLVITHDR